MAWSAFCPVFGFLSSTVATGSPLTKNAMSTDRLRIPEAEVQLPRDGENVRVVLVQRALGEGMPGPEVREVNLHPPVLHPLPQHIQHPARVDLGGNPQRELPLRRVLIPAVQLDKLVPLLDLRPPHELPQRPGINPQLSAVKSRGPLPPVPQQLVLNPILKRPLGMRSRTHTATPPAVVTSICPVTAAVISACRRSARSPKLPVNRFDQGRGVFAGCGQFCDHMLVEREWALPE